MDVPSAERPLVWGARRLKQLENVTPSLISDPWIEISCTISLKTNKHDKHTKSAFLLIRGFHRRFYREENMRWA
jgi:hypothetical protein